MGRCHEAGGWERTARGRSLGATQPEMRAWADMEAVAVDTDRAGKMDEVGRVGQADEAWREDGGESRGQGVQHVGAVFIPSRSHGPLALSHRNRPSPTATGPLLPLPTSTLPHCAQVTPKSRLMANSNISPWANPTVPVRVLAHGVSTFVAFAISPPLPDLPDPQLPHVTEPLRSLRQLPLHAAIPAFHARVEMTCLVPTSAAITHADHCDAVKWQTLTWRMLATKRTWLVGLMLHVLVSLPIRLRSLTATSR